MNFFVCWLLLVSTCLVEAVFEVGKLNEDIRIRRPEGRRLYDIYIPKNFTVAKPALLISLHAANSNRRDQESFTMWEDRSEADGNFIPVWPLATTGKVTEWSTPIAGPGVDDRGLILAMIEDIKANITIDETRIYITGYSSGAAFAQWFATVESDTVAAVAGMAGLFSKQLRDDALALKAEGKFAPKPVFLVHGYNDMLACWSNWHCFLWRIRHQEAYRFGWKYWAEVNNCTGDPTTIASNPGGLWRHLSAGRHYDYVWIKAYETCEGGVEVRQTLNSRDHSGEFWSGNLMANQKDYNDEILEFLFRFQLNTTNTTMI